MSNEEKILNPMVVHEIAAQLFWRLAESVGVAEAFHQTEDSNGWCLFAERFSSEILGKYYEHNQLSVTDRREILMAVAAEAATFAVEQKNLQGIVYTEDLHTGRSPSAMGIDSQHLNKSPVDVVSVSGQGNPLIKRGTLCIRHPLPSVVFTDELDCMHNVFEVENTELALGFHFPLFMQPTGYTATSCETPGGRFVIHGYFHIPVPDKLSGDLWSRLVMNSMRFVTETTFHAVKREDGIDTGCYIRAIW